MSYAMLASLLGIMAVGIAVKPPDGEALRDLFSIDLARDVVPIALMLWIFAGALAAAPFLATYLK
jgi:hypothetical protein